jgi:hypothetical protein
VARELDQDELIERWTLIGDDLERVASKRSAAKLGFALLLKFFARGDPAPVHSRSHPPDPSGDAGGRPRPSDHLLVPLPAWP